MTNLGNPFGSLLRGHRKASGLTQEELAERSGLSVRGIADMERGRTSRPNRYSVQRLADALSLSPGEHDTLLKAARAVTARSAVHQLPAEAQHFAARDAELQALTALARQEPPCEEPLILAITGAAGVGKTALAVHWAHKAASTFPDGELYADLRGFDPSADPAPPDKLIAHFLRSLGQPAEHIPDSMPARLSLYRGMLQRRRMLILLDNARDTSQVRPLLPGTPGSVVIVTSRNTLTGLVVGDGAQPLGLHPLNPPGASAILTRRLGPKRVSDDPRGTGKLIRLSAGLPLALAILAARAAEKPGLPLAKIAAEITAADDLLGAMETGEPATSLRSKLTGSYRLLDASAARMFRLLGANPSPHITVAEAAVLADIPTREARALISELTRQNLVAENANGSFTLRTFERSYAQERHSAEQEVQ